MDFIYGGYAYSNALTANTAALTSYLTTSTYGIGSMIRGDGTNGLVGALYCCKTAATTGTFALSKWDLVSLSTNSTNLQNAALGVGSWNNASTGLRNASVGYTSLTVNTSGSDNVSIGYQAMLANTTGLQNVAVGRGALSTNISGASHVAIGYKALQVVSTADNCTAIGWNSLAACTGGLNTAVGFNSGASITTGLRNTYVGGYTGSSGSDATTSYQIILSDGVGNIGIKIPTGNAALAQNLFLATPNGATGPATPRAIVNADLPSANQQTKGTWTPALVGWTNVGTPTVTGTWTLIGNLLYVGIQIVPATTVSSTVLTSTITGLPRTVNPSFNGVLSVVDITSGVGLPNASAVKNTTTINPPSISATADTIVIAGIYSLS